MGIIRKLIWLTAFVMGVYYVRYLLWTPGLVVRDGRHDLNKNGIWLQHGWLGDNLWFKRNNRDTTLFRSDQKIAELHKLLSKHNMKYLYPHLCPCRRNGTIPSVDNAQTKRFLNHFGDFKVLPWVGGVLGKQCYPDNPKWRSGFVTSVVRLLELYPRMAGVHVNIEPMPSGNPHFLTLLKELKTAVPKGKMISVAAYPPPTIWHRHSDVHWDELYFRQVASLVDQVVPMMYDTALRNHKLYQKLMADWTEEVLMWSGDTEVLLGLPAYDDAGVGYHFPEIENLQNGLAGIHSALSDNSQLPDNYSGIAVYCEWEMDEHKWDVLALEFEKPRQSR